MSKMFSKCSSFTSFISSKFNSNKVKEMSIMFFGCLKLKEKTKDKDVSPIERN